VFASRAALLTGRYPTRVGVPRVFNPQDQDGLNRDETTLADVLKARKYRTMCVGSGTLAGLRNICRRGAGSTNILEFRTATT